MLNEELVFNQNKGETSDEVEPSSNPLIVSPLDVFQALIEDSDEELSQHPKHSEPHSHDTDTEKHQSPASSPPKPDESPKSGIPQIGSLS
ncbi:hypothetical protein Tco_1268519 [Tanacetum coccineum]